MATPDSELQLTLRIDLDADPITGSLSCVQGATRRFTGWIGLAAALEAIRAERRSIDRATTASSAPPR